MLREWIKAVHSAVLLRPLILKVPALCRGGRGGKERCKSIAVIKCTGGGGGSGVVITRETLWSRCVYVGLTMPAGFPFAELLLCSVSCSIIDYVDGKDDDDDDEPSIYVTVPLPL